MKDILIGSLMTRDVSSAEPATPLIQIIREMYDRGQSCTIIVEEGTPVGIVTERDLVRVLANVPGREQLFRSKAGEIMSAPPVTISENVSLYEALVVTRAEKHRHLPVVDDTGKLVGLVAFTNLTEAHFRIFEQQREIIDNSVDERTRELVQANEQLRAMSFEDGLLGIGNRRAMEIDLQHSTASAIRYQQPYSVILVDVDYFKRYNDTYGHLAGDQALKTVAGYLKASIRASDRIYRYGGEEILVILPNTAGNQAQVLARRMVDGIMALEIAHHESPLQLLTISAGIGSCHCDASDENWENITERADQALYQAKQNGRNRVMPSA